MKTIIEQMETKLNIFERLNTDMGRLQRAVDKWRRISTVTVNKKKNLAKNVGRPFNELFVAINTRECLDCKRSFNEIAYCKHAKNCRKIFMNKRKQFDSKKQRILNLEHAVFLRRQELLQKKKEMMNMPVDKNRRWKKMSERFRTVMRISRLLLKAN